MTGIKWQINILQTEEVPEAKNNNKEEKKEEEKTKEEKWTLILDATWHFEVQDHFLQRAVTK